MAWQRYRTIVEDRDVTALIEREMPSRPRLDQAWEALQWLLARKADEMGISRVVGSTEFRLYKQAGDPVADTPDITVLFSVNDAEVVVHGVKIEDRQS